MIHKIVNSYKDWRNKRQEQRIKAKWTALYLESVGRKFISDNGFGEGVFNKQKYVKPRWNRNVKPLTTYEVMRRLS